MKCFTASLIQTPGYSNSKAKLLSLHFKHNYTRHNPVVGCHTIYKLNDVLTHERELLLEQQCGL